ncbi:hypothetical protein E2C01_031203 [Portunus trituberculatus]|uniref:Uncharacterized protein n=1 Tax=Portunus trituberculatus TaxID=210409 RepID=A0A5B7EXY8_PORTR|nr:hypothetical protein [Portunus trituberculatus]
MVPRRGWLRLSFLGLLAACALVYVYYYSYGTNGPHLMKDGKLQQQQDAGRGGERRAERQSGGGVVVDEGLGQIIPSAQCRAITPPTTDVNTVDQFPKFEFQFFMAGSRFLTTALHGHLLRSLHFMAGQRGGVMRR